MLSLSPAQHRFLKAKAHALHPVVMVGDSGLTEAVVREADRSLKSHELIKVKVASDDRRAREGIMEQLCAALEAAPVQHIGKILVLYRPAEKPKLVLPQ